MDQVFGFKVEKVVGHDSKAELSPSVVSCDGWALPCP